MRPRGCVIFRERTKYQAEDFLSTNYSLPKKFGAIDSSADPVSVETVEGPGFLNFRNEARNFVFPEFNTREIPLNFFAS
jgi:hypothetical protein